MRRCESHGTRTDAGHNAVLSPVMLTDPLADMGGPAKTHVLLPGSPAQPSHITAANDTLTVMEDAAGRVAVLIDGSDEYAALLTVTVVGTPSSGTATLNSDGTTTYTSAPDFNGTAPLTYTVTNALGDAATAIVVAIATAVNDVPTATVPAAQNAHEEVALGIIGIFVVDVDGA